MQRRYGLFDMVVVIGFCATIAAAGLLVMAANGRISISHTAILAIEDEQVVMELDDVRWLQPILGQAIVDQYLLDRRYATDLSLAKVRLAAVSDEYTQLEARPFSYLDSIRASTIRAEPDHATRVQEVMGRAIVQFTQRGVQRGMLPSGGDLLDFNTRMIDQTDDWGQQMDAEFLLNWQANLGRAIVGATQDRTSGSALVQERLGSAIIELATVHFAYDATHLAIEDNLSAATAAAVRLQS
ncbi:MAG: hypothetical protein OEV53_11400 [Nitrospira sp.]|nr:hypothetical protein [Nitrospira sp.]